MELTTKNFFYKYGYAVIRNFFSKEEVEYYKKILDERVNQPSQRIFYEKNLWKIAINDRLINVLRDLINDDIYFLYHADSRSTSKPEVEYSWHRDNPCRRFGIGDDWDKRNGDYRVLRVGIYFQSYSKSKSCLNIFKKSHKTNYTISQLSLVIIKKISKFLNNLNINTKKFENFFYRFIGTNIQTDPGDIIIFLGNILHSATITEDKKYAIFLTYGPNDIHSQNHMNYYFHYRNIKGYDKKLINEDFFNLLKSKNIFIEIPKEKKNINGVSLPG